MCEHTQLNYCIVLYCNRMHGSNGAAPRALY